MAHEGFLSLTDAHTWVFFATVGFVVLVWKKGRGPMLAFLDARTAKIKAALDEAERLKNEAQDLLADVQRKHRDAIQTSQKIIDAARENAVRLQRESEEKLADGMKRREAQLMERIRRAEAAAMQELREQAADIAAKSAEMLLQDALPKRASKLVDEAIADIPAQAA
jgi:F-type H+-transporting ATPase subunit b